MDFFKKLLGGRKTPEEKKEKASVLAVMPEEIYQSATLELQDVIAPSALKIASKSISLGDKIARTFFIISYPRFQKKVAEVQSQISVREGKGMVRDPMLDTAYQDLEGLRNNLIQAQEKMFDVGIYITIYADNELELFKIENEIKSILESKLIYIKPALFQQEEGFKSVIPINSDLLSI